jgi:hypothetical protein
MDAIRLRELVLANLDELGRGTARWIGERLLFRDRFFVGTCFDFEGVSAIWLSDVAELRFIDERGALLKAVPLVSPPAAARQAA